MLEWKKNNLIEKYLDYSFFVPKQTKREFILKLFDGLKIARISFFEEFEKEDFRETEKRGQTAPWLHVGVP